MAIFDPSVLSDDGGASAAKAAKAQVIVDINHDGVIDGQDLQAMGLQPGSVKAKVAWEIIEAKALASKSYAGKPLQPGPHAGDGDFSFLVDRLVWHRGLPRENAIKIAASVNQNLSG